MTVVVAIVVIVVIARWSIHGLNQRLRIKRTKGKKIRQKDRCFDSMPTQITLSSSSIRTISTRLQICVVYATRKQKKENSICLSIQKQRAKNELNKRQECMFTMRCRRRRNSYSSDSVAIDFIKEKHTTKQQIVAKWIYINTTRSDNIGEKSFYVLGERTWTGFAVVVVVDVAVDVDACVVDDDDDDDLPVSTYDWFERTRTNDNDVVWHTMTPTMTRTRLLASTSQLSIRQTTTTNRQQRRR